MFTPITRFFVCIFWNAVRNHRISMFTPITRFLVCICRLFASTPVNGHKLSVAVYDTGPLTLNSLHYYYQDYAFQSYRPRTMKAIQNNKGCNPVWAQLVQFYEPSQQWQQLVRSYESYDNEPLLFELKIKLLTTPAVRCCVYTQVELTPAASHHGLCGWWKRVLLVRKFKPVVWRASEIQA